MLYQLGFDHLEIYDNSMSEWAMDTTLPIETGHMTRTNEFGQAIGEKLPVGWKEPIIPNKKLFLKLYAR